MVVHPRHDIQKELLFLNGRQTAFSDHWIEFMEEVRRWQTPTNYDHGSLWKNYPYSEAARGLGKFAMWHKGEEVIRKGMREAKKD